MNKNEINLFVTTQVAGLPEMLEAGETKRSGMVELTAGTYKYNCPLNPTPQYTLTVE